jgi:hypothetical protein
MDEENFPAVYHEVEMADPHDLRLKEAIRRRIWDDTDEYLSRGGVIQHLQPGDSGWVAEWRLPGSGFASLRAGR